MKKKTVDRTDIKIINLLQKNANLTNKEIAENIGLSESNTLVRVRKLIENNILGVGKYEINFAYFGFQFEFITIINIHKTSEELFTLRIKDFWNIFSCKQLFIQFDSSRYIFNTLTRSETEFEEIMINLTKDILVFEQVSMRVIGKIKKGFLKISEDTSGD
jgi:DNA-binding Lrp family transcriptional regulator